MFDDGAGDSLFLVVIQLPPKRADGRSMQREANGQNQLRLVIIAYREQNENQIAVRQSSVHKQKH